MSPQARIPSNLRLKNNESSTDSQTTGVFARDRCFGEVVPERLDQGGRCIDGVDVQAFADQNLGNREARPAADIDDSGSAREPAGPLAHQPRTDGSRRRTAPTGKKLSSDAFISIGWVDH